MNLTTDEIQLVKSSYQLISEQDQDFAAVFYQYLFELEPLIRPMFKSDHRVFEAHFNEIIATAVDKIDKFSDLETPLLHLGKLHLAYDVRAEQFPVVKSALLMTIQDLLKQYYTRAIELAWSKYYDELAAVLQRGMQQQ